MHTFYFDSHIPNWLAAPVCRGSCRIDGWRGAQFENTDTGERILVYSPQRWYGTATVNAVTGRRGGAERRRRYLIELCSPTGTRCDMPLEILGLPGDHTYFGTGWPQKSRRRTTTKRSISSSPPSGANTASGRTGAGTSPTDRLTALTPSQRWTKRLRRCLIGLPSGFRLWPAVRCAQGHGLRCAPGTRLANFPRALASLAGKTLRPDLALRGPIPAQISSARRQTERAATAPSPRKVNHD